MKDAQQVRKGLEYAISWGRHMGIDDREFILLHCASEGAARTAESIARDWGWVVEAYPAKWKRKDGTQDMQAGRKRNRQMLESGKPDICVAFWEGKVNRSGTLDMMSRCVRAGVPTTMFGFQTWRDRKRASAGGHPKLMEK